MNSKNKTKQKNPPQTEQLYPWWEGEEGKDLGPASERKLEPSASLTGSEGSL